MPTVKLLVDKPNFQPPQKAGWTLKTSPAGAKNLVDAGEAVYVDNSVPQRKNPDLYQNGCIPLSAEYADDESTVLPPEQEAETNTKIQKKK